MRVALGTGSPKDEKFLVEIFPLINGKFSLMINRLDKSALPVCDETVDSVDAAFQSISDAVGAPISKVRAAMTLARSERSQPHNAT
jgi:hypothetical protein